MSLADEELCTGERSRITPAWFWLATFEMFYYTGIRLNALLCLRLQDIDQWLPKFRKSAEPVQDALVEDLCVDER